MKEIERQIIAEWKALEERAIAAIKPGQPLGLISAMTSAAQHYLRSKPPEAPGIDLEVFVAGWVAGYGSGLRREAE